MNLAQKLAELEAKNARLEAEKQALSAQVQEAQVKLTLLEEENGQLKRLLYGQKRERFVSDLNPAQLSLDLGLEEREAVAEEIPKEEISYLRQKPQKKKHKPTGRQPWPAHLKRVEIQLVPEGDLEGMNKIGEHRTEELDYIPAKPFVRVFVRPIYADPQPDPQTQKTRVVCAELPPRIISKSSIGPGMLAAMVCDKFQDHLPIYRQLKRYERLGVKIAASTVGNSLSLLAQQLAPLGEALQQAVFRAPYLQGDETRVQVLASTHNLPKTQKKKPPGKTHRGYFWSYFAPGEKLCWFEYCPGRGKTYPRQALKDFQGKLQTDGYGAYDQFAHSPTITLVGCLAHVRRKFFEAKNNDPKRANKALDFIKQLYALEQQAQKKSLARKSGMNSGKKRPNRSGRTSPTGLTSNYPMYYPKVLSEKLSPMPSIEEHSWADTSRTERWKSTIIWSKTRSGLLPWEEKTSSSLVRKRGPRMPPCFIPSSLRANKIR
jgi:transposase